MSDVCRRNPSISDPDTKSLTDEPEGVQALCSFCQSVSKESIRTVIKAHGHYVVRLLGQPVHGQDLAALLVARGVQGTQPQGEKPLSLQTTRGGGGGPSDVTAATERADCIGKFMTCRACRVYGKASWIWSLPGRREAALRRFLQRNTRDKKNTSVIQGTTSHVREGMPGDGVMEGDIIKRNIKERLEDNTLSVSVWFK